MLTDDQRAVYGPLADVLIPEAEGMPSATGAGVANRWIDKALGYRPDLVGAFAEALEVASGKQPAAAVELLNSQHTEAFDALGVLTSGAYFLNPDVKQLIGYPGQVPTPARDDVDSYFDLLSRVVDRGPIYRPTVTS